ncbi:hypothetical protein CHS0354_020550 [Potamilus streckersoni]|uniref:Mannosyltransferase n=1 Tax=Potamilus streckersoni TaxID=2493646 RepID=A0AAE0SMY6_9BIVA|nr:hypothetical protein CHS0354_020550 [Potamilus streckersoni]
MELLIWGLLLAVRIGWCYLPQNGYIHPDEFFQTVEIVAGDILDVSAYRAWEFNVTAPVRSPIMPYVLYGPVFHALKYLNALLASPASSLTASQVLRYPRLVMAVLSLGIDFSVYTIAKKFTASLKLSLLFLGSSYVMLTYQCRTFTNSIETLIFTSLMYLILTSKIVTCKHDQVVSFEGKMRKEKSKGKKLASDDEISAANSYVYPSYARLVLIGFLTMVGFFNRPTFLIFAFLPLLWYLFKVYISKADLASAKLIVVSKDISLIGFTCLVTFCIFCTLDSVYYGKFTFESLTHDINDCLFIHSNKYQCFKEILASFVITPRNFIKYNVKGDNLIKHGLHPFYLHLVVNLPLLFGPLVYFTLTVLFSRVKYVFTRTAPIHQSSQVPFDLFVLVPVLFFSIFPHQEPRFLIPLLPLVILNAIQYVGKNSFSKFFFAFWLSFNLVLSIFYGILHQGSIIPCITDIQEDFHNEVQSLVEENHSNASYHFMFSSTYMPPRHLFLNKSPFIEIIDFKGGNYQGIKSTITRIKTKDTLPVKDRVIILILPGTVFNKVQKEIKVDISILNTYFPHLSLEDPPDLKVLTNAKDWQTGLLNLMDQLSLYVVKIT